MNFEFLVVLEFLNPLSCEVDEVFALLYYSLPIVRELLFIVQGLLELLHNLVSYLLNVYILLCHMFNLRVGFLMASNKLVLDFNLD